MPRRLGTTVGLCACAGALTALTLGVASPWSDAASHRGAPTASSAPRAAAAPAGHRQLGVLRPQGKGKTTTPIKHVVVIFDENISYDHYFGTYPKATNKGGTKFHAYKGTPKNDNLVTAKKLKTNANLYKPFRLAPTQAMTCDQNHNYANEQRAFNNGAMDQFVQNVSVDTCGGGPLYGAPGLTMGYYDGNTVTGLWNYAQNFAMSDSFFGSNFGPSTPGAINLVSGNTHGFQEVDSTTGAPAPGTALIDEDPATGVGSMIGDPQPFYDDCSVHAANHLVKGTGRNIGDLLNAKGVSWGWFQGGFAPTTPSVAGSQAVCGSTHANIGGSSVTDYIPHHNPFSYYASTANPHHLPPTSIKAVGKAGDQANHNYDLSVFGQALKAKSLPSVSFVKAPAYQDGHGGYSDPIDEQHFLIDQINAIQKSTYWSDTAIVVAYDDSDGWYDHRAPKITNGSGNPAVDTAMCGGVAARGGYSGRCGPGPRLPMLVISPYTNLNHVDHHVTEQASILRFIEDNWKTGQIGDNSFDARAGSMKHMFNFKFPRDIRLLLKPTGAVKKLTGVSRHAE